MKQTRGPARSREGYHWFRGWRKPSAAQRRVLDELLTGGTNAQIAERLGISEDGVKWHLSELREEVGLADRRELAEWWSQERSRPAVHLLAPIAALWRFATRNAVATVIVTGVVAVSIVVGWLAYGGLHGDDGEPATGVAAAAMPSPTAPAIVIPTPTPTPVPIGALLFDLDTGEVSVLPGVFNDRRWLNTEAMTFTVSDGKASMLDAEGHLSSIAARSGVQVAPDTDNGRVVIWNWDGGLVEVVDMDTLEVTQTADFGRVSGSSRIWAVTAVAGKIAISDEPFETVTTYDLDASSPLAVLVVEPGRTISRIDWSRGGEWLLIVTARLGADGRPSGEERSRVFDVDGALVLEREGRAGWAGVQTLEFSETGGPDEDSVLLDVAHQTEIPFPRQGRLLCISPDSRYAVLAGGSTQAVWSPPVAHEVFDLVTHETVLRADAENLLPNCDWTPDGRKVVLSYGGK